MKTKLSFVALLCMMLLCAVSCKKDDPNGGDTPNLTEADFFIDVDFLPESETNGEVAPRLMVNFNDEVVMIELRKPSTDTPMETVLLLCPDKEAMMLCGNDSLMVCASYDIETYTPSNDVLLVTLMDENSLILTKGFMDWNSNTMTTGDMMVLPIDDGSKNCGNRDDIDKEMRWFFFNRLIKPIAKSFEKFENSYGTVFGGYGGLVLSYIRTIITTESAIILFSDDPESFIDAMESTVTMETAQGAQLGILHEPVLHEYRDMASRIVAAWSWCKSLGHGKVNDYVGGTGTGDFPSASLYLQAYDLTQTATTVNPTPIYIVNLDVSNVTENSAFLKGRLQYTSSITPVEMGYVVKLSGGPEHTEEDMNFHGKTISGLQKATKYTAYAYANSMGNRVVSPEVTFWTLGFEAFPNSLTFPSEGDTKYVGFSYSHEDITSWDITNKPSWCTTSIDDLGLLAVTVGASTEARSGTITISAHSNALGNVTENISVTQLGSNPTGFFTGTPFDNIVFNMGSGNYQLSTTWTERVGEGYDSHTHTYSSFHNETHTNNETSAFDLKNTPFSFDCNTLTYNIEDEGVNLFWSWSFTNDSIIIDGYYNNNPLAKVKYKNGFLNNYNCFDNYLEFSILFPSEILPDVSSIDNGTFMITCFFEQNNVFCIKENFVVNRRWQYDNNDWGNTHREIERLNKFIIDEHSNNCTFEMIQTCTYSTPSYGSQFHGTLSLNETEHSTVNGTWARIE